MCEEFGSRFLSQNDVFAEFGSCHRMTVCEEFGSRDLSQNDVCVRSLGRGTCYRMTCVRSLVPVTE